MDLLLDIVGKDIFRDDDPRKRSDLQVLNHLLPYAYAHHTRMWSKAQRERGRCFTCLKPLTGATSRVIGCAVALVAETFIFISKAVLPIPINKYV